MSYMETGLTRERVTMQFDAGSIDSCRGIERPCSARLELCLVVDDLSKLSMLFLGICRVPSLPNGTAAFNDPLAVTKFSLAASNKANNIASA